MTTKPLNGSSFVSARIPGRVPGHGPGRLPEVPMTSRSSCSICQLAEASVGILCRDCQCELTPPVMVPEQITGRIVDPTRAALVDFWGRVHLLDPRAMIGRNVDDDCGIAIHEGSVSLRHACLELDPSNHTWSVSDLGSSNGTLVEDVRVEGGPVPIHPGDKLRFGQVSFYFLDHVYQVAHSMVDIETVRPNIAPVQPMPEQPTPRVCEVQLHEPTGGGGGIVQIDGKQVQLTLAQLELVTLLIAQMEADADRDTSVRGFVSVADLLGKISLEATMPREAHVRQLIRRVRRVFIKTGLGELIESRYGLGYRILVIPR